MNRFGNQYKQKSHLKKLTKNDNPTTNLRFSVDFFQKQAAISIIRRKP